MAPHSSPFHLCTCPSLLSPGALDAPCPLLERRPASRVRLLSDPAPRFARSRHVASFLGAGFDRPQFSAISSNPFSPAAPVLARALSRPAPFLLSSKAPSIASALVIACTVVVQVLSPLALPSDLSSETSFRRAFASPRAPSTLALRPTGPSPSPSPCLAARALSPPLCLATHILPLLLRLAAHALPPAPCLAARALRPLRRLVAFRRAALLLCAFPARCIRRPRPANPCRSGGVATLLTEFPRRGVLRAFWSRGPSPQTCLSLSCTLLRVLLLHRGASTCPCSPRARGACGRVLLPSPPLRSLPNPSARSQRPAAEFPSVPSPRSPFSLPLPLFVPSDLCAVPTPRLSRSPAPRLARFRRFLLSREPLTGQRPGASRRRACTFATPPPPPPPLSSCAASPAHCPSLDRPLLALPSCRLPRSSSPSSSATVADPLSGRWLCASTRPPLPALSPSRAPPRSGAPAPCLAALHHPFSPPAAPSSFSFLSPSSLPCQIAPLVIHNSHRHVRSSPAQRLAAADESDRAARSSLSLFRHPRRCEAVNSGASRCRSRGGGSKRGDPPRLPLNRACCQGFTGKRKGGGARAAKMWKGKKGFAALDARGRERLGRRAKRPLRRAKSGAGGAVGAWVRNLLF